MTCKQKTDGGDNVDDCKKLSELLADLPDDVRSALLQKFTDEANGAARAYRAMNNPE